MRKVTKAINVGKPMEKRTVFSSAPSISASEQLMTPMLNVNYPIQTPTPPVRKSQAGGSRSQGRMGGGGHMRRNVNNNYPPLPNTNNNNTRDRTHPPQYRPNQQSGASSGGNRFRGNQMSRPVNNQVQKKKSGQGNRPNVPHSFRPQQGTVSNRNTNTSTLPNTRNTNQSGQRFGGNNVIGGSTMNEVVPPPPPNPVSHGVRNSSSVRNTNQSGQRFGVNNINNKLGGSTMNEVVPPPPPNPVSHGVRNASSVRNMGNQQQRLPQNRTNSGFNQNKPSNVQRGKPSNPMRFPRNPQNTRQQQQQQRKFQPPMNRQQQQSSKPTRPTPINVPSIQQQSQQQRQNANNNRPKNRMERPSPLIDIPNSQNPTKVFPSTATPMTPQNFYQVPSSIPQMKHTNYNQKPQTTSQRTLRRGYLTRTPTSYGNQNARNRSTNVNQRQQQTRNFSGQNRQIGGNMGRNIGGSNVQKPPRKPGIGTNQGGRNRIQMNPRGMKSGGGMGSPRQGRPGPSNAATLPVPAPPKQRILNPNPRLTAVTSNKVPNYENRSPNMNNNVPKSTTPFRGRVPPERFQNRSTPQRKRVNNTQNVNRPIPGPQSSNPNLNYNNNNNNQGQRNNYNTSQVRNRNYGNNNNQRNNNNNNQRNVTRPNQRQPIYNNNNSMNRNFNNNNNNNRPNNNNTQWNQNSFNNNNNKRPSNDVEKIRKDRDRMKEEYDKLMNRYTNLEKDKEEIEKKFLDKEFDDLDLDDLDDEDHNEVVEISSYNNNQRKKKMSDEDEIKIDIEDEFLVSTTTTTKMGDEDDDENDEDEEERRRRKMEKKKRKKERKRRKKEKKKKKRERKRMMTDRNRMESKSDNSSDISHEVLLDFHDEIRFLDGKNGTNLFQILTNVAFYQTSINDVLYPLLSHVKSIYTDEIGTEIDFKRVNTAINIFQCLFLNCPIFHRFVHREVRRSHSEQFQETRKRKKLIKLRKLKGQEGRFMKIGESMLFRVEKGKNEYFTQKRKKKVRRSGDNIIKQQQQEQQQQEGSEENGRRRTFRYHERDWVFRNVVSSRRMLSDLLMVQKNVGIQKKHTQLEVNDTSLLYRRRGVVPSLHEPRTHPDFDDPNSRSDLLMTDEDEKEFSTLQQQQFEEEEEDEYDENIVNIFVSSLTKLIEIDGHLSRQQQQQHHNRNNNNNTMVDDDDGKKRRDVVCLLVEVISGLIYSEKKNQFWEEGTKTKSNDHSIHLGVEAWMPLVQIKEIQGVSSSSRKKWKKSLLYRLVTSSNSQIVYEAVEIVPSLLCCPRILQTVHDNWIEMLKCNRRSRSLIYRIYELLVKKELSNIDLSKDETEKIRSMNKTFNIRRVVLQCLLTLVTTVPGGKDFVFGENNFKIPESITSDDKFKQGENDLLSNLIRFLHKQFRRITKVIPAAKIQKRGEEQLMIEKEIKLIQMAIEIVCVLGTLVNIQRHVELVMSSILRHVYVDLKMVRDESHRDGLSFEFNQEFLELVKRRIPKKKR